MENSLPPVVWGELLIKSPTTSRFALFEVCSHFVILLFTFCKKITKIGRIQENDVVFALPTISGNVALFVILFPVDKFLFSTAILFVSA